MVIYYNYVDIYQRVDDANEWFPMEISPCLIRKFTISMAISNSYVKIPEGNQDFAEGLIKQK